MRRWLVIFAKEPRPGRAKRRLARDVGAIQAAQFQRRSLARAARALGGDSRWTTRLAVEPATAVTRPGALPRGVARLAQGGGDLGDRLHRFLQPPPLGGLPSGPAVVVGSDIPGVQPRHIAAAFAALQGHDLVLGPAPDGGYWLIGARRGPAPLRGLFAGVRWSSQHALADTAASAPQARIAYLPERLADIDDGAAFAELPGRWRGF